MNIGDLEKDLGNFKADTAKVIDQLLTQSVLNGAFLKVILSNQAEILRQINPDVDVEQFEKDCFATVIQESNLAMLDIISKVTK